MNFIWGPDFSLEAAAPHAPLEPPRPRGPKNLQDAVAPAS